MSDASPKQRAEDLFAHPVTGSTLTVLSGLSFLLVCMLLPMVGPAGAATPFAARNHQVFAAILVTSLALSMLAIASKLVRRRRDHSPLPMLTLALCGMLSCLLIALCAGLLRV